MATRKSYRITADSAAFVGLTGLHTNKIEATLKVKSLESYATFYLIFPNLQGNEIVELLDKSENVVRTLLAKPETVFEYLNPGDYFLRLFVDENATTAGIQALTLNSGSPKRSIISPTN